MNLCEQAKKEQWPLNECAQCGVLDFSFQLKINGFVFSSCVSMLINPQFFFQLKSGHFHFKCVSLKFYTFTFLFLFYCSQ